MSVAQKVMDTAKLAKAFIKLRDTRAELKREFEEKDNALKAKQEIIEAGMLDFMNKNKMDSIATTAATFYKQLELKPSCSDWDAFYRWITKNNAFEFLERRVTRTAVKEFMDMNDGGLPPGVSVHREYVVRVRRSS